jgi:hypothetical protein
MDWADTEQVLRLWVKLRESLLEFCRQEVRTRQEVVSRAGDLVVEHEAPLPWIERLTFTVSKLTTVKES